MKISRLLPVLVLLTMSLTAMAQVANTYYNEGKTLRTDKKYTEAIEKFTKAVMADPNHFDAHYELGWCYNELKNYGDAITSLRKARQLRSDFAKVHFELGYAFQNNSAPDSASACYDRCLSINPKYSLAFKQKGYLYYNKDNYSMALDMFRRFEQLSAGEIKDYLFWFRKGYSFNDQKMYDSAKTALLKSLNYKKDYATTYYELGYAATRLKQADEAIGYFNQGIALEPKSHVGYNGVAEVYRDLKKDYTTAMSWYEKSLGINAWERKANFGKGYCLNSLGRYSEAVNYLRSATETEKTYTAAYVELGYTYYMLGRNEEGLTQLNKALELSSSNQNARYYKGLIYISQNNKYMAQKMVDELKQLNSTNAPTLQAKVDKMN